MIEAPYYPIIYVRGYAGSRGEVEDTVATPYMGFNLGSTKLRQTHAGRVVPHVFESPLVRLMKDYGYVDAYRDGEFVPTGRVPPRSIWIFRYYDDVSRDLGDGTRREIEHHAAELRELLLTIRARVLDEGEEPGAFRVHLVAHSMGGLVCRAYLQNPAIEPIVVGGNGDWAAKGVDRLFTYATPHGGIEFRRALGWLEGLRDFLDVNESASFGERRMREFLALDESTPVDSLAGRFPTARVFCLVGTDARDYGAAAGFSRRAVGPLSDGLVRIENASVRGAARAFVHRSHSGHYGIVNSESGFQNMARFLFGDVRVEATLEVDEVTLPPKVQQARDAGREVKASYHVEVVLRVRGARWDLHRRLVDESSAIFRTERELVGPPGERRDPPHLFTAFLEALRRVNTRRPSLGFSIDLGVLVPEYAIERRPWDQHHDGGYLFRDKVNVEVNLPEEGDARLRYGYDSRSPNRVTMTAPPERDGELHVYRIPVAQATRPGIRATLVLRAARWA